MSSSLEQQPPDLRSFLPKWKIKRVPIERSPKWKIKRVPMERSPNWKIKHIPIERSGPKLRFPKRLSAGIGPPPPTYSEDRGICGKETASRIAETALTSYNLSNQDGPEYELVEVLGCILYRMQALYHGNFIARPKNGSQEEDKLFFGEVKMLHYYDWKKKNPEGLACLLSCILGHSGTTTGENGCTSCIRQPGLVQHPEDGFVK